MTKVNVRLILKSDEQMKHFIPSSVLIFLYQYFKMESFFVCTPSLAHLDEELFLKVGIEPGFIPVNVFRAPEFPRR